MPTHLFSIIVPSFQRPSQLEGCLSALTGQRYAPERYEIIIVDDGSDAVPEDAVTKWIRSGEAETTPCRPRRGAQSRRRRGRGDHPGGSLHRRSGTDQRKSV